MVEIGIVVAVIVALGQLYKLYFSKKYLPLVNLVLGIFGGFFFVAHQSVQEAILTGIMIGLAASGLFDTSKAFTNKQNASVHVASKASKYTYK